MLLGGSPTISNSSIAIDMHYQWSLSVGYLAIIGEPLGAPTDFDNSLQYEHSLIEKVWCLGTSSVDIAVVERLSLNRAARAA